jgi:DNA polymerase-3 subunit alpha (Gram-positive type)
MKAFLDIETGGFSISKNGICEIAIIVVDEQLKPVDTFHTLIKPYTRADDTEEFVSYKDDAMAINGLTIDLLINEGVDVKAAITNLVLFLIKWNVITLIGHNSRVFDIPRIQHLVSRFYDNYQYFEYESEDTMLIAKEKLNLSSYSLENLCNHFGIINTDKHSAKGDAFATIELYKRLNE